MNEKIEELKIIGELLREWVVKYDDELHAFADDDFVDIFNNPDLPKEQCINVHQFYEPDGGGKGWK